MYRTWPLPLLLLASVLTSPFGWSLEAAAIASLASHSGDWQRAFCPQSFKKKIPSLTDMLTLEWNMLIGQNWVTPWPYSLGVRLNTLFEHWGRGFPQEDQRIITKIEGEWLEVNKDKQCPLAFWRLKAWNTSKSRTQETKRQHICISTGQCEGKGCESLVFRTENHCSASPHYLSPRPIIYTKWPKASLWSQGQNSVEKDIMTKHTH